MKTGFETQLQALSAKVDPLERLLHAWSAKLPAPLLYDSGKEHYGFRYGKPHMEHFCLLKAVRAVSGLNAAIYLARGGYSQEIFVLLRTLVECMTHIEFVITDHDESAGSQPVVDKYVEDFFADFARNSSADFKRAQVKQGTVHRVLGAELDKAAQQHGRNPEEDKAERLYSNVYLTYSNYVHAKYPEIMDMYGGAPGHFHLSGMRGTPKDDENLAMIECAIESVSIALMRVVTKFKLHDLIKADSVLADWFHSMSDLRAEPIKEKIQN